MTFLTPYQTRIERLLNTHFAHHPAPSPLKEAMQHATLNGGKRIRPALVWMTAEALDLPREQVDAAALAIELIHCYSLVHDDLPAMDDDDLRRGQPTVHIAFDEATAILAGDALLNDAFETLSHAESIPPAIRLRQLQILSRAAGSDGMVAGQMMDMSATGRRIDTTTLRQLHERKTGRLIQAAFLLGAAPARDFETLRPHLAELGLKVGLAFQVQDDILDEEQTTEHLGKPAGSDREQGKNTYPALMGMEAARTWRDRLIEESRTLLTRLPFDQARPLHQLIDFVASRSH